jgi:hypothetical protein
MLNNYKIKMYLRNNENVNLRIQGDDFLLFFIICYTNNNDTIA